MAWEWSLLLFIPIPILWPRFRGISAAEWKRALGWHAGARGTDRDRQRASWATSPDFLIPCRRHVLRLGPRQARPCPADPPDRPGIRQGAAGDYPSFRPGLHLGPRSSKKPCSAEFFLYGLEALRPGLAVDHVGPPGFVHLRRHSPAGAGHTISSGARAAPAAGHGRPGEKWARGSLLATMTVHFIQNCTMVILMVGILS